MNSRLSFVLPPELQAGEPPEARGLTRDAVRMMVGYRQGLRILHSSFSFLPALLEPDDLVVINTSGTLPAALTGIEPGSATKVVIHLSNQLDDGLWLVEPRRQVGPATERWAAEPPAGQIAADGFEAIEPDPPRLLSLGPRGARIELLERYQASNRLWIARLSVPDPIFAWLAVNGQPIRYSYVEHPWPIGMYQNVYVTEPGSAELPSAGRPFTAEIITRLVAKGVGVTPVVLHTGVASLEADERPYPERVKVPAATARRVNDTKASGGRVIAIGTTVVRALESAFDPGSGQVTELAGWTDLVITPERGVNVVDGLLTGWHEAETSHILMLEAIAGPTLLEACYDAGLEEGYLWHEFGDVNLLLP